MLVPLEDDLPAFRLRFADGSRATIYESGYSEGLPEDVSLEINRDFSLRRALRVAEAESIYG